MFTSFVEQIKPDFAPYDDYAVFVLDSEDIELLINALHTHVDHCEDYLATLKQAEKEGDSLDSDAVAYMVDAMDGIDLGTVLINRLNSALEALSQEYDPLDDDNEPPLNEASGRL